MNEIFEIRLKKEFGLLQRLQKHKFNKNGIVKLFYKDRSAGNSWRSILEQPTDNRFYPYQFKVTYTMPMYVAEDVLKKDWSASFTFETPEDILMNPNSSLNNNFRIDSSNGRFPEGEKPFNNHVSPGWVCTGTAWSVANQGFGIWYFIISVGALFNLDKGMMAHDADAETHHLNRDAYRFWKNKRNMQPTNDIAWPWKGPGPIFGDGITPESSKKNRSFTIHTDQITK